MSASHSFSGINLLPKSSFEFSTLGKVLKWITSAGRVLVVLTEFVVLLAFGSRFYFDKKLDDLKELIVQKEAQIEAYAGVEAEIRKMIAKQTPIENVTTAGARFEEKINALTKILPNGVTIDSMSIDAKTINVNGKAVSEYGFAQFLGGAKKIDGVISVAMKDTNFDQTTGSVRYSIQIGFK